MHDHLGSTCGVFDGARAALGTFEHTPYGSPFLYLGPSDTTQLFTGHDLDAVSGKHYAPFRYLDSDAGRWPKRDPLGMVNGPNMYGYVGGSPTNFYDSLGLEKERDWMDALDDILDSGDVRAGSWVPEAPFIDDSGRGAVEAPAAFGNGLVPGNPFGECVNEREPFAEALGEELALAAIPFGGYSRGVKNAFRRTVKNLSKPGTTPLSPQKLGQLRRMANKLGGDISDVQFGERGRGGSPHVHVTGLGQRIRNRHIPVDF